MNSGFTFFLKGKDYFVPSALVKRTKKLAQRIIIALGYPETETNIEWMFQHIERCDMEQTAYGCRLCGDRYGNNFTLCVPSGDQSFVVMEVYK